MANPTTNLSMTKPTVGGSTDTWGTTINENVVDIIDALFSISGTDVTMSDIKFNSVGLQETGAGTDTVKIQAPAAVTQYTLTMPAAVGASGQILRTSDASGTLAWVTDEEGDLKSVANATNGGMTVTNGTGPDVTLTFDANGLETGIINVADDFIVFTDANDSNQSKKDSIPDLVSAMGGTGLTGASGVLAVDASQTQITAVGTLATGTWSATTIAVNKGGSGLTSYAAGDILYASGATTLAKLAKGSDTEVLTLASGVPTWAAPTVGDITGVTAGTGLSGGGTSGTVTLNVEAAQTQITSVGTLTSLAVGNITSDGNLVASGTGPHAIGRASVNYVQTVFGGSFTSGGASDLGTAAYFATALTGAVGDTGSLSNVYVQGNIITQGTDTNIGVVSSLNVSEPGITNNLASSGKPDVAATVYIKNAPTEGDANAALYVAAGDVMLPATGKLYLDGGGDTYIKESSANNINIVTNDVVAMGFDSSQNAIMKATGKLYLDGGSNTYIVESSGDVIKLFTGGTAGITLDASQDVTIAGDLVVSGTGPHAIGGAVNADAQLTILGSYQGNRALGISSSLTPNVGEYGTAVNISPTLIEAASGTHAVMAGLYVESLPITTAGGATTTVGSSVYIGGPATGASANYSLFVASGASTFLGDTGVGTAPSNRFHVKETGTTGWLAKFEGNNTTANDVSVEMCYSGSGGGANSGMNIAMDYATGTGDYVLLCSSGGTQRFKVAASGLVHVAGELTAGTKTFRIDHPLPAKKDTHQLVHSCIEAPKADLIYRGTANLSSGVAQVDLDEAAGMTAGTWELLCRDPQVWIQNDSGWSGVRGSVEGSTLTIESQDIVSDDTVSWMVVAERQDEYIKGQDATDDEGHLIVEPEKESSLGSDGD